ncbi:uncharacterized protein LOC118444927 [Vespa mandarinia]|uniref:uncharacterized protein LOC118444927 n=1 Tax=Vespa mandarinia TaxID=7446 RepID=UPI001617784E|nr:uncharacterized protein LOC118444927 [Vespa mandarinia]XP_046819616.1 uncharacterized protein LOC124424504 [Vespa crabro]XP_047371201.1 uncharacterized protein LOC124957842 [Vespa velutina]
MKFFVLCSFITLAVAQPAKNELWKGTNLDQMVDQTKAECAHKNDEVSCMKFKVLNLLDQLFRKDNFKVSESVEITRNSYPVEEISARGEGSFLDNVQSYLTTHDVTFKLPLDSTVKVSSRNIEDDRITFDVQFGQGRAVEARKSKLKKVVIPILVFVLLKAMTLIPLAIGVLGLKAWNALQLSFFSFIVSVGMAIFQLCKKIAAEGHAAPISAHGPWEYQTQYRSFQDQEQDNTSQFAQNLAYSGYAQS